MRTLLRALPDIARTIARLAADPILPTAAKVPLAAAVVYLVSPVDLIPDLIPVLGALDDVLVAAIVVDGRLNSAGRRLPRSQAPARSPDADGPAARGPGVRPERVHGGARRVE